MRALIILSAGVVAGMQVGKLPPALGSLKAEFGMTLVQASFLVSAFQVAGISLGIVGGLLADRLGARRVMAAGLGILALASALSTFASTPQALLVLRALESAGFLLAVLPGPVLLRRTVPNQALGRWLGLWGMYMPLGMGSMLLVGPWIIEASGWKALWWWAALLAALPLVALWRLAPDPAAGTQRIEVWSKLIAPTLRSPGPWLLAWSFGCYAAQWMAVFTFLPLIFEQAGLSPQRAGLLTAIAALVNAVGNGFAATVLRFWAPARLIAFAAIVMALSAWVCFGGMASFANRYGAVLVFSAVGGFIPGTLFVLSSRLAASSQAGSTTVGLMQQGSAVGQAIGPPLVAAVAASAGAWNHTWMVTSALAVGVLLAAIAIRSILKKTP